MADQPATLTPIAAQELLRASLQVQDLLHSLSSRDTCSEEHHVHRDTVREDRRDLGEADSVDLALVADETGLRIHVSHLPPGTSKWNKIEHRLFCHITQNWRGRPLVSHEVIVNLIGATTTSTGLKVRATMDEKKYPTGIKVSDEELGQVKIKPDKFHGEWNYLILPNSGPKLKS